MKRGKVIMKKLKNLANKLVILLSVIILSNFNVLTVRAGAIQASKGVTGTVALLNDVSAALMIISPIATGLFLAWNFFKMQSAEDETEAKPIKKRMKVILICGVGVFLAATIFNVVLGYYK